MYPLAVSCQPNAAKLSFVAIETMDARAVSSGRRRGPVIGYSELYTLE
jgi:hypothetical protein